MFCGNKVQVAQLGRVSFHAVPIQYLAGSVLVKVGAAIIRGQQAKWPAAYCINTKTVVYIKKNC
jgi:hypothetical protein